MLEHNEVLNSNVSAYHRKESCPVCGSSDGTLFFSLASIPVHVGIVYDTANEASQASRGTIELVFCRGCSHVFNRAFDASKALYRPGYAVALNHSAVFRNFMNGVADRLVSRFELRGKKVFEIGCGNAWFLELLCTRGGNGGVGVDPTATWEGTKKLDSGSLQVIRRNFDASFASKFQQIAPDFVCCLSVFEHISEPTQMLRELRQMMDDRQCGVYFEIFNAMRAFQQSEVWSVLYEQPNYFSPESYATSFRRSGFDILEGGACYEGDQYLFIDAIPSSGDSFVEPQAMQAVHDLPSELSDFSKSFNTQMEAWSARLQEYQAANRRVVFWGAGGKGVSFLNLLPTKGLIELVVENNPEKQGKHIAGSGQRIVSPECLVEYQPDVVILSNVIYEQEIREQTRDLGIGCDFYVA